MSEAALVCGSLAFVGLAVFAHCWAWLRSRSRGHMSLHAVIRTPGTNGA